MPNFFKKAAAAYWAQVTKLANHLERKELPETAFAVKATALFPLAVIFAAPLAALIFLSLPATALAGVPVLTIFAATSVGTCAGMGAFMVGTSFAGESIGNYFSQRKIKTITNEAGQTVTGSAFDLSRLDSVQKRVTALSSALSLENDATRQEQLSARLSAAFDKAAPYAARVTVIADPANQNDANATYAFVKTQKTISRATAA